MTKKDTRRQEQVPGDVDEYLASLPNEMRAALQTLRGAIRKAAPAAEETISYRIPTYKLHGPLVHFVARENYCSFIITSAPVLQKFKKELEPFEISGTTIHFTPANQISAALVKRLVKARIAESEKERTAKENKRDRGK